MSARGRRCIRCTTRSAECSATTWNPASRGWYRSKAASSSRREAEKAEELTTETQRHRERQKRECHEFLSSVFLCVSVSLWLAQNLLNRRTVVHVEALPPRNLQLPRIQPQLVQDSGVDVGDVVPVLGRVEADLVCCAVYDAALQSATGHPDREAV